jgi:two-component system nitrogen regulation response regulator GlnG/two-component system response regulator HydG
MIGRTAAQHGLPTPVLELGLVERLLRHRFTTHARELERLLWQALADATGERVGISEAVAAMLDVDDPIAARPDVEPTRDAIVAALRGAEGNVTQAARDLGLKNRFALYRLMKRHGIAED